MTTAPLPAQPVRPLISGSSCAPGFEALSWVGRTYCFARADTQADIGEGHGACHPCIAHVRNDLAQGHMTIEGGYPTDGQNGLRDAYCRRVISDRVVNDWTFFGDCPPLLATQTVCAPASPQPTPPPGPPPTVPPGTPPTSVDKLLLLNFGKCQQGLPFVFLLGTSCKELFATATPKQAFDLNGDGKVDDAVDHGEDLTWTVTYQGQTRTVTDSEPVDLGCAVVAPGPTNLRWNRRIVGRSPCRFELHAWLVTPDGKRFDKGQTVEVR